MPNKLKGFSLTWATVKLNLGLLKIWRNIEALSLKWFFSSICCCPMKVEITWHWTWTQYRSLSMQILNSMEVIMYNQLLKFFFFLTHSGCCPRKRRMEKASFILHCETRKPYLKTGKIFIAKDLSNVTEANDFCLPLQDSTQTRWKDVTAAI